MLIPGSAARRTIDSARAIGQLSYMELLKAMGSKAGWLARKVDWQQSYKMWDGLDDPYREMDFFVDGHLMSASTASVLIIQEASYRESQSSARSLLTRLVEIGVLTTSLPDNPLDRPWETYGALYRARAGVAGPESWIRDARLAQTDRRLNDPARFLTDFPMIGDFFTGNRSHVLPNLPTARLHQSPVFIGPNFWNTSGDNAYTAEKMMDDMSLALSIIVSMHKAANVNPAFSPAMFYGMSSPDWSSYLNASPTRVETWREISGPLDLRSPGTWTESPRGTQWMHRATAAGTRTFTGVSSPFRGVEWVERDISWFPSRYSLPKSYMLDPDSWDMNIMGTTNPIWLRSANTRQRQLYEGSIVVDGVDTRGASDEVTGADAVTDYAQVMSLLSYLVDMQPQVLTHSAMYFHNYLFRQSYNQIDVAYGTKFQEYRRSLELEYVASRDSVSNAMDGFNLFASPVNIEAATVQSLAVALGAVSLGSTAVMAGGVIGFAVVGIIAIIEELSREPYVYNPDKSKCVLRDNWLAGPMTNFYRYYTPETVIQGRPIIRLSHD